MSRPSGGGTVRGRLAALRSARGSAVGRGRGSAPDRERGSAADRERGSAAVELVGIVTLLLVVTWLCVQGLYVAQAGSVAERASRDGARAGAVPGRSVAAAVEDALPGWAELESLRTGDAAVAGCAGSCVRVDVRVPLSLPGVTVTSFVVTRDAELPRG